MNLFFDSLKKLLCFTMMVAFIAVFAYTPLEYGGIDTKREAYASIAVFETNPALVKEAIGSFKKESLLDRIAWQVAKSMVSNITASTITWINSGFEGSPAFVQDLDRYLIDVADQAAGQFITSLGPNNPLSFLCSPFQLDIQVALAIEYDVARERQPYRGCRISEFTGDFERFIDGEFSQGGWEDWFRVVAQPEIYTPIGAYLSAEQALQQNIQAARAAENQNIANSNGFLSFKLCEDIQGPGGITEPDCRIVTPGATIADRLSDSLGLGEQSLIAADEINEVIGALVNQVAVQAISGTAGLLGLSQGTGYTYSGFNAGSLVDAAAVEGNNAVDDSLAGSLADLRSTLTQQENFLGQVISYNVLTGNLLGSPNNLESEDIQALEGIRMQTRDISDDLLESIDGLEVDIAEYEQIEQQLTASALSASERQALRSQQVQILSRSNTRGIYDQDLINEITRGWDLIIDNL